LDSSRAGSGNGSNDSVLSMILDFLFGLLFTFLVNMAAIEAWHHPAWHWLWRKLAALVLAGWGVIMVTVMYFEVRMK
jgi:hypothetical protein